MLPAKSRSTIVVDGSEYHWTRGRGDGWVTVQHESGNGSLLRIDLYGLPMPADIADAIRFALAHGWSPFTSGPMFFIGFTDVADRPRFVVRAHDSPDYWRELQ